MRDPAGKGIYFVNGKSSGIWGTLQPPIKTIHGHHCGKCHAAGGLPGMASGDLLYHYSVETIAVRCGQRI